jgi:hypothetical protein
VYLAGGMPDGATFPFQSISIDLKDGSTMKIDGKLLETALQYQGSAGYVLQTLNFSHFFKSSDKILNIQFLANILNH